ncbi:MAG: hypothetical protein KJ623_04000 [Nanoarchaeota archaeon]|nr:hypothetical protein [Nanoarchaeota archaeon]
MDKLYNLLKQAKKNILKDKIEVLFGAFVMAGVITLTSICTCTCKGVYNIYNNRKEISEQFYIIVDKNRDGYIEEQELESLMKDFNIKTDYLKDFNYILLL